MVRRERKIRQLRSRIVASDDEELGLALSCSPNLSLQQQPGSIMLHSYSPQLVNGEIIVNRVSVMNNGLPENSTIDHSRAEIVQHRMRELAQRHTLLDELEAENSRSQSMCRIFLQK